MLVFYEKYFKTYIYLGSTDPRNFNLIIFIQIIVINIIM